MDSSSDLAVPEPRAPFGLRAWRAALAADGVRWRDRLLSQVASVRQNSPSAAWIAKVEDAQLAERLQVLETQRVQCKDDAAELYRRFPLFGVPFAVKDNIDADGWMTTAACPAFARPAAATATAVQRLLDAGAVLLGKTNLDQFATGLVGTRSPYGIPVSTWDPSRVSGGSSSGSAVTVARGDVVFSLGTDTAGSGRIPAGFNQIVGVKPTPGRVSTAGVVPACRSLDCISIFALDVADGAEVLAVIEGSDGRDPFSRFAPGPAVFAKPAGRPLRVGVPREPRLDAAIGYTQAWEQAVGRLSACGVEVVPLDFEPLHRIGALLYEGPWVAERLHAVQELMGRNSDAFDPAVGRVIEGGRSRTAVDAFDGQYALRALAGPAEALWREVDFLMVPTAPTHPTLEDLRAEPLRANAALGHYTNYVNLLGWCALAQPAAVTGAGLPFGVTFIAAGGKDAALLDWGRVWQKASALTAGRTNWTPGAEPASASAPWPATESQMPLAVVGAHLTGEPLNGQLTERGARLLSLTRTASSYRLHALAGTVPPKPGLERVTEGGVAIEVEIWSMPTAHMGSFLQLVPSPLAIGSIELADGRWVQGFVCEPTGLVGALDISAHGGWRAWRVATPRHPPLSASSSSPSVVAVSDPASSPTPSIAPSENPHGPT